MKIVIVGGGTAGWISAYFIEMCYPKQYDITVIESSSIGVIGAGEGSTGVLVDLLNGYFFENKIDIDDFLINTDGTKKFGIKHINWSNNGNYFAPLDASPTGFELDDYYLKYIISKNRNKNTHLSSKIGIEYENNLLKNTYAMHFDGHKVGNFFKKICISHGIKIIDSVVNRCNIGENGFIDSLDLENNQKIYGDIFIDCTGFSKKIISSVGSKWQGYSDILPVNTAMPFIINNDENEKIDQVTKSTALSAGWMWEIPLKTRKGMGYVFDRNFISEEDAKIEVENYLKTDIDPIKIIKFESGHLDKFWNKNVIAFGLSSSFVEPLEATSIHNTIIQISIFVKEFLTKNKNNLFNLENEKVYNRRILHLNKLTIDFISIHYQGGREDSEFWKYIKNDRIISDGAKEYMEFCKNRIPGFINLEGMFGSYSIPLANWISSGLNILNPDLAKDSLIESGKIYSIEKEYNKFYSDVVNQKTYVSYS